MRSKLLYYIPFILLIVYGCSNIRHLPDGEVLYTGAEVKIEDSLMSKSDKKALKAEMEELLRPKPNRKILGWRFKLSMYNLAGEPKKEKGFRYWLRNKVGEPPVTFKQVDMDYNADVLQNRSENRGYFKTRTSADSTSSNRKGKVVYTVRPGKQYTIRNVIWPDSLGTRLDSAVTRTKRRTRLRPGSPYDLDKIKDERNRIDERLKEKGYFFFNPDYLIIRVDSTVGDHQVDLRVRIKEDVPERAKKVYTINNIFIYPNYSLSSARDTLKAPTENDSVQKYKDFTIIDKEHNFRPIIYDRTLYFHKGDIYNRKDHNLSLNRLVNLGTFRFVKNQFKISDSLDTALDTYYFLTPLQKKSIRTELSAKTNSANYNGSELTVNWSNRNTFKAAELLSISVFGGLEVQMAGQNKGYNVYRVGSDVSLTWPRFITPFKVETPSAYVPKTKVSVGYEYQNRQKLYSLNSFKTSFGYLWKEDITKEHELKVLDVVFVSPSRVTEEYNNRIEDDKSGALQRAIDKQLIFGPTYSYTYTNTMRQLKKNTIYYKGSFDLAGNITGLLTGANVKKGDTVSVFGVPFSQYAKTEHDFRFYHKFSKNSQLATRAIVGIGYPYGNSSELPYIRQFFVGGTNSIRAFRARSIGPGTYRDTTVTANSFLPDQSGDIKIEMNAEYRMKLYSVVHGAVFVDAGNIWLWNKKDGMPGAEFTSDFYKEFAVGTGVGLRLDLSFLILRLDGAFPLRKPWLPEGDRWVLDDIDFGSRSWRKENFVLNLAIGYPF